MQLHNLRLTMFGAAILLAGTSSSSAHADIIYFENPAEGQNGHFAWQSQGYKRPVTFETWLDITRPSTDQFALANGNSVGQLFFDNGGDSESFTAGGADVVGDPDTILTQAFEFGDDFSGGDFRDVAAHWCLCPEFQSDFPEGELRYMGVLTESGNYGWIAVIREGSNFAATLNTTGWAYETEPGVPLLAGQIPAPGAISVFALAGLMRVRRRRR